MLKIDDNVEDRIVNSKKMMMDRLNMFNKSPVLFDKNRSLKIVKHSPSPMILRIKPNIGPCSTFLTGSAHSPVRLDSHLKTKMSGSSLSEIGSK